MASRFTSEIWWKGALKSGLKETLRGLVIGFVAAGVLFGVASAFGLTSAVGALLAPMVTTASGGFSPVILVAFCSVISGVTALFTGGGQALAQEQQQQTLARDEAKLIELDGRTRALEQSVSMPNPSHNVQRILERGPQTTRRYADAKLAPGTVVVDKITHVVQPRNAKGFAKTEEAHNEAPAQAAR